MKLQRRSFSSISHAEKFLCIVFTLALVLFLLIGIPTLSRFKNRVVLVNTPVWDGSVANKYHSGTGVVNDPYIISNGSELAYFKEQLKVTDYSDTYFKLSNDIKLNNGIFSYDETNGISYILNDNTYYINQDKYYDNLEKTNEIGIVNIFESLNGFKGHFDGSYFRIYGLYMTNNTEELALFTNLNGNINNLYVENAIIYGTGLVSGVVSKASSSNVKNVLFDGYVISNSFDESEITNLDNIVVNSNNFVINIPNNNLIDNNITSNIISGNYIITNPNGNEVIKINNVILNNNNFKINLSGDSLDHLTITVDNYTLGTVITFSNLVYTVNYDLSVAGGVVAYGNNIRLENIVNRGSIYSKSISGGIAGILSGDTSLLQSYNTGLISSDMVSGGLIGKLNNGITEIDKTYNTSNDLSGGLLGKISNSKLDITNTFDASNVNAIGINNNSDLTVSNSYFTDDNISNSLFTFSDLNNFKNKNYVINNFNYSEFIDFNNISTSNDKVWVYEPNSLPILFIDDINEPIVKVYANSYSWDSLSSDLKVIPINSNITFSINNVNDVMLIKNKYYYISDRVLTYDEINDISWKSYTEPVEISNDGNYVIYAKIVDYSDNVKYINSDLLMTDTTNSLISINLNDKSFTTFKSKPKYIYIGEPSTINITNMGFLKIKSIKYYISEDVLSTSQLNNVNSWTNYKNPIQIDEEGKYIIYVKVIDENDYVTYVNTDYIVFNGYKVNSMNFGYNVNSYSENDNSITDKSLVTFNITYSSDIKNSASYTHNIVSNILLPEGTKMILYDNILNQVYEYKITTEADEYNYDNSCLDKTNCIKKATYPLILFKEIGTKDNSKKYIENNYYSSNITNEDFNIIIDFSDTEVELNSDNVEIYMELRDNNDTLIPTITNTIKEFNVYSNKESTLELDTDYIGNIDFNSDSKTNININSYIDYKYINNNKVIDTLYENKNIGLAITIVDINDNIVDNDFLKSIMFSINNVKYKPDTNGITYINLNSGLENINTVLTVDTYKSNVDIVPGTYYIKINSYVTNGKYYDDLSENNLMIPIIVSDQNKVIHGFNILIDDQKRIINKSDGNTILPLNIVQNGDLNNPNIKISLYKKSELNPLNQNYEIVDLIDYISDELIACDENVYYAFNNSLSESNSLELNLIANNFESNSYKLVFELYDDAKKVSTISKYFIVK